MRLLYGASLLLCVSVLPACCGEILVRVINAKSGRPEPGQWIEAVLCEKGARICREGVRAQTDGMGEASITVDEGRYAQMMVYATDWGCQPASERYDLSEIRRTGVVTKNGCYFRHPKLHSVSARPGEIVIFRYPLSFWERVRNWRLAW